MSRSTGVWCGTRPVCVGGVCVCVCGVVHVLCVWEVCVCGVVHVLCVCVCVCGEIHVSKKCTAMGYVRIF